MNPVTHISLDDAPGVGQTDVAFSPEELETLFQVTLRIQINLEHREKHIDVAINCHKNDNCPSQ